MYLEFWWFSFQLDAFGFFIDAFAKSQNMKGFVIPAHAGIQVFQ